MVLLQQLQQNALPPTKMALELVEFWHFRTPPNDRFPIRKRSARALRNAKRRIGSGTENRNLNLAVNSRLLSRLSYPGTAPKEFYGGDVSSPTLIGPIHPQCDGRGSAF